MPLEQVLLNFGLPGHLKQKGEHWYVVHGVIMEANEQPGFEVAICFASRYLTPVRTFSKPHVDFLLLNNIDLKRH
jgi:hypothetical protein